MVSGRTPHRKHKKSSIAKTRKRFLEELASAAEPQSIRNRVGFILSNYPHTRDSDVELCIHYWMLFHPDVVNDGDIIQLSDLHKVERVTNIVRARQKIQNEFRLFVPSPEVQQRRLELTSKHREEKSEDKPTDPVIQVICDESGKNERYAMVGSVWVNDPKRYFQVVTKLMAWKYDNRIDREFHFTKMRKQELPAVLEFMRQVLSEADALCFKAVLAESAGTTLSQEQIFTRLHVELCIRGLQHERDHGRAELPRVLDVLKDSDFGTDKFYLSELERRLKSELPSSFENRARVSRVEATDSKFNVLIQVADLFTGSLSRVLNHRSENTARNHKDEFADALLSNLGLDPEDATAVVDQDLVMIGSL